MNQEYIGTTAINKGQFDTMWDFLQMGKQEGNPEVLKEYCERLRHMMMQKTAGQRKDKPKDEPLENLSTILNIIIIESMCLYLSGDLDKLITMRGDANNG